jgi:polyisoprenoid-binding protein YceI
MKNNILVFLFLFVANFAYSQNIYKCTRGTITFFSKGLIEDIKAQNKKVTSFLNKSTGEVLINMNHTDFKFDNKLMKEHYNENFMESEKYPKGEFKGTIESVSSLSSLEENKEITLPVTGILKMHNVEKERTINVTFKRVGNTLVTSANFDIYLEDHHIEKPSFLMQNLADKVHVSLNLIYEKRQ